MVNQTLNQTKKNSAPREFHFNAIKAHLTYKTHIPFDDIKDTLKPWKMLSIVHEVGDEHEDEPMPYAHTHVFVWWKEKFQTRDPRAWDIDGIHPNVQTRRSILWAKNIVMNYHHGRKTKADGKKYYIKPILLHQEGVEEWKFQEDLIATIQAAPTLIDAMHETDIMPKSIADLQCVRREGKRKFSCVEEQVDVSKFKELDWDRKKALVLRGPPAIGKTNWAISQFKAPFLVCDLDDLKAIPEGTDGLVFDEMLFFTYSKQKQVYLTDLAFERTIRTRNTNAKIPAGMQRIFTCNLGEEVFRTDGEFSAVARRFNLIEVCEPLFN